ncbi:hypothetical protein OPQ81_011415 [Rhizoctonia solani]|nr:hypothetical protein OPQ81_011415 [Rhizoctonia solani]
MAAAEHKEKGNAAFKAGDYPAAIGHYTSAILADGTDPTFPLNRAAAYLKLNKNEDAERDCTTVLKLRSNNVKALFRRAQARVALGNLSDARADLVAAAKAEPGNAAVRTEFTKVEGLIAEAAKKAKTKGTPISLPSRTPAPSEPSGTPYRRRVPIAIVNDGAPEEDAKEETAKPKATPAGTAAPPKGILKNASSSPAGYPTTSQPVAPSVIPISDGFLTAVSTRQLSSSEVPLQKAPVSAPSTTISTLPTSISPTKPATPLTSAGPAPSRICTSPPTLMGFLQRWSNTRTDADKASVLFAIPPSSVPSLFGPTLESPLLGAMLGALSWALASAPNLPADDIPQRTLAYLTALAQVPRFPTLILFLDAMEKKSAKDIWDGLEQSGVEPGPGERKKWGC